MITGACGFIGSHLTKSLIDADYEVCAIDNLDNNLYPSIVKQDRLKYLRQNGLKNFYELDLSKDNFDNILDGATYVFNLAALPGQVLSWSIFDKYVDGKLTYKETTFDAKNNTDEEIEELRDYLTQFINDVDKHFKWNNFFYYEWYLPFLHSLNKKSQ